MGVESVGVSVEATPLDTVVEVAAPVMEPAVTVPTVEAKRNGPSAGSGLMGKPLKDLTYEENKTYQNLRAIKSRGIKKARAAEDELDDPKENTESQEKVRREQGGKSHRGNTN